MRSSISKTANGESGRRVLRPVEDRASWAGARVVGERRSHVGVLERRHEVAEGSASGRMTERFERFEEGASLLGADGRAL